MRDHDAHGFCFIVVVVVVVVVVVLLFSPSLRLLGWFFSSKHE